MMVRQAGWKAKPVNQISRLYALVDDVANCEGRQAECLRVISAEAGAPLDADLVACVVEESGTTGIQLTREGLSVRLWAFDGDSSKVIVSQCTENSKRLIASNEFPLMDEGLILLCKAANLLGTRNILK